MGDYLPPGTCDDKEKAVRDAQKNLDKAFRAWQSAENYVNAGLWGTAAGGIAAVSCFLAPTGVGAIVCVAAAGATMIGGEMGTLAAGQSLINAKEDLDDAFDAMDKALDELCKCIEQNMLSVPD